MIGMCECWGRESRGFFLFVCLFCFSFSVAFHFFLSAHSARIESNRIGEHHAVSQHMGRVVPSVGGGVKGADEAATCRRQGMKLWQDAEQSRADSAERSCVDGAAADDQRPAATTMHTCLAILSCCATPHSLDSTRLL